MLRRQIAIYRNVRSPLSISFSQLELYFMYHMMTPEKRSRLGRHRYAREWTYRSRVRALEYWSTLYRSNKANWQEEHGEHAKKSYYLAMHDWNRRTDDREWSTARYQVLCKFANTFCTFFSSHSFYRIDLGIRVLDNFWIIINWTSKNIYWPQKNSNYKDCKVGID